MLISKKARSDYGMDESLFDSSGNVVFPDLESVHRFVEQLKDLGVGAGHINGTSLIHEIFHFVVKSYARQLNPEVLKKALDWLDSNLKQRTVDEALRFFVTEFPPLPIFNKKLSIDEYMVGSSNGQPNRQSLLMEMLMLWLDNVNPAQKVVKKKLFDDSPLIENSAYSKIIEQLERFFQSQPLFGPKDQNIIAMLRSPAIEVPNSIQGQLNYIREHWGELLEHLLKKLLTGLDLIKEETKSRGMGPGETPVFDFSSKTLGKEYEKFSEDLHWMPRLVLMAKSTHVWLDQLSKKYNTHIYRLDQIPDQELDLLAQQGFTGLWLIGVWQRSKASERIKQICGNPEAMASAYSIFDYRIADNLGGSEALYNLKERAWKRGIRMASDMVPNHMGIDSPWLADHPDRFLYLPYCPYPNYSFTGVNLSSDSRISIYLEDHYYDRTDAAVVFKWVNNLTGEVRYIYHGNDGTSMPWNDTAQLNYLNPETRDAVTRTIVEVAEKFPVIRFDAAMTLTQKHYQRLWFPEPGAGGDIPTRAGNGLTFEGFMERMPEEFWRQVVDLFAEVQSDTLLLAEAFWLMEAYFVRTLGMHRVYNSAFMNFLKNEHNDQYRLSIKNVLQFNREILKRFVNFMNNPDEETAIAQFGKDDKYFGVCTLMATLPGLPMFGHGQIEGFREKYGMEYRKAYWDESPDQELLNRHEREIFPLLRKRYLFADVEQFLFYDFFTADKGIDENVIAYSNRWSNEASLVIYHNTFAETAGWVKMSAPFTLKTGEAPVQKNLGEGLGISYHEKCFVIFRDHDTGLQYIRSSNELHEQGLYVELKAFKKHVFLEFREVWDNEDRIYQRLTEILKGSGVPSIPEALRQKLMNPLKEPFQALLQPEVLKTPDKLKEKLSVFLSAVKRLTDKGNVTETLLTDTIQSIQDLEEHKQYSYFKPAALLWQIIQAMAEIIRDNEDEAPDVWILLEDWLLLEDIRDFLLKNSASGQDTERMTALLKISSRFPQWKNLMEEKEKTGTKKQKSD